MSMWYELKAEDIEIDTKEKEFNLHVGFDDQGNNYATITFDQIKAMYEELKQVKI